MSVTSKVASLKARLLDKLEALLGSPTFDDRKDVSSILTVALSTVKTFHDEAEEGTALKSPTVNARLSKFVETRGSA